MKGAIYMTQLNKLEIQNLRHLIGSHETAYQKLSTYANQATDPQIKQLFQQSAQDAQNTKTKLLSLLS
jgi:hypothetical protein